MQTLSIWGLAQILYLFTVGFVGGLVSGFIGSGGAFVLTPAKMSLGVPEIVAVASNMCHKFPKALVAAIKRARYGQVDLKLGLIVGVSAERASWSGRVFSSRSGTTCALGPEREHPVHHGLLQ